MMRKKIYILIGLICLLCAERLEAQTCNKDFTIKTAIIDATCLSNGQITVTLEGDITNISDMQYELEGLTDSGELFVKNPQSSSVLTNIPPGTYTVTVRAFCTVDTEYEVVKDASNIKVGGSYVPTEVSLNSTVSRKSYEGCNTGIIALDVTKGNGDYTFTLISAPSGVSTPAVITPVKDGDTYTFPGENYPEGEYIVQVDDGCYNAAGHFTLGTVKGFPAPRSLYEGAFRTQYKSTDVGTCSTIGYFVLSDQVENDPDYQRYYNDGMYEMGVAPAGQIPTSWTDWNATTIDGNILYMDMAPYTVSNFYTSNLSLYTRLKGCSTNYTLVFTSNLTKPSTISGRIKDRYCDYYAYSIYSSSGDKYCYPLRITVRRTNASGQIVHDLTNWYYDINYDDVVDLEYNTTYHFTITDQNGTTVTATESNNRNYTLNTTPSYSCDTYTRSISMAGIRGGTQKCLPVTMTITSGSTTVCTQIFTDEATAFTTCPLEYNKSYSVRMQDSDGYSQTISLGSLSTNRPTAYTLSTQSTRDRECEVNVGTLQIDASPSTARAPAGTVFTVTGPAGFTTWTNTISASGTSWNLPYDQYLPEGEYTLTVNHCGGTPIVTKFNMPGIYNYQNFSYTSQESCEGLRVYPTGTMTYQGTPVTTYYQLIDGPTGYDKSFIPAGGYVTLALPGSYRMRISATNSSEEDCVIGEIPIEYETPGAFTFDPSSTLGYICVDNTIGDIQVRAMNGVGPYIYELWNADNTVKIGVPDIVTSSAGHFSYGEANTTYTVRMSDQCGNQFYQEVIMTDLNMAKIVYTPKNVVCIGDTIQPKCITLGGVAYSWTGPNGFTSLEQNPIILNAQIDMTGWYKVSVQPEFCDVPKLDSVYIRVALPLEVPVGMENTKATVCVRENITLTGDIIEGGTPYTYQWQLSVDGVIWEDIIGETGDVYTPSGHIRSGLYYYRRVTTDACGDEVYNDVELDVLPCYVPVNPALKSNVSQ